MDRRSENRLADSDFRNRWISEEAFYQSEIRKFSPGSELDDWLYAEKTFEHTMLRRHTLHKFDSELQGLHSQVVQMADLTLYQLKRLLQVLNESNIEQAELVIADDQVIDDCKIQLDNLVLQILCLEHPVANDLSVVLCTAKISYKLESIGNELADLAKLSEVLLSPENDFQSSKLLEDVVALGKQFEFVLGNLIDALKNKGLFNVETLLQFLQECQTTLQESIFCIVQDNGIRPAVIELLKMMESFESCAENSVDIARYLNRMNQGIQL
jgi:phosphate transport system protein